MKPHSPTVRGNQSSSAGASKHISCNKKVKVHTYFSKKKLKSCVCLREREKKQVDSTRVD